MSPRAAWRLESLGFSDVYDYVAGEADWYASGLPMEGTLASVTRAGDLARPDVPTCQLGEPLETAMDRSCGTGWDACVVVHDERIVLGLLRCHDVPDSSQGTVEQHMESGPSTYRPDATLEQPLAYMRRHNVESVLVTTSDGRLSGLLMRADVDAVL
jgi:predicted transcriptional regulator